MDKKQRVNADAVLKALDAAKTAISVYDKDANIVFANRQFFRDLFIGDREAALGRNINELLQESGISVTSLDQARKTMKMMEVIETGEEAIDWEVRVTSRHHPDRSRITSNDMYPVKDEDGTVQGMIELNRSRQQDMNKARRFGGLSADITFEDIIGESPAIRETIRTARRYADNPFNLLITGESGVGKEMFAQSVHNHSSRRNGPFVALNCSSFPENLIESELFGYVGGAFTGASRKGQIGKFELADGGTLFLDEIGEMPYHFQAKILRVLETWTITRIGGTHPVPVNVRLIAATNRNLEEMVEQGLFREDLYYRLAGLHILVPPLRERKEDILCMAEHFLHSAPGYEEEQGMDITPQAQAVMEDYGWPGNVRELRNIINRASVLAQGMPITAQIVQKAIYGESWKPSPAEDGSLPAETFPKAGQFPSGEEGMPQATDAASSLAGGAGDGAQPVRVTSADARGSGQTAAEDWDLMSAEERLARRARAVEQAHADYIREALRIAGGKVTLAAELLNVSRKTMYRFMEKYGIDSGEYRAGRRKT